MEKKRKIIILCGILLSLFSASLSSFSQLSSFGQKTQIRGFVDALTTLQDKKVTFGFGEQDLFISSELSDRFSFLGESVFKFDTTSSTNFSVSVERVIIKYNYYGNHNILIGKHHTPVNYWNDTYHHGRVFFPTIDRPLLFAANIIPLHTVGISFQGSNLGNVKFGYDLMIGNGLGSEDVFENDKRKSVTAAVHIKPADGLRFGVSWYNDEMAAGTKTHDGKLINWAVKQNLFTGSVAYFGQRFELLTESTFGSNHTDTTGTKQTLASYIYAGVRIKDKIVPYARFDRLHFQEGEILFDKNNTTSIVGGIRYEFNYLIVAKLEYQHLDYEMITNANKKTDVNKLTFQLAVGF